MKHYSNTLLSAFYLLLAFCCSFSVQAGNDKIPVAELLRTDGTLELGRHTSGSVNFAGFAVTMDPCRGPVFSPMPVPGAWNPMDKGFNSQVNAIVISGTNIYVGGTFTDIGTGGAPVSGLNRVAKWNGTAWSALDKGLNNRVYDLAISGTDLYAVGRFTGVGSGGTPVTGLTNIAKWNGSAWSALDKGLGVAASLEEVFAITVHGSDVYAGGTFTQVGAGGTPVTGLNRIARWNGTAWSALGSGLNADVRSLAHNGSALYAGGDFNAVGTGGTPVAGINRIASWDGTTWVALDKGLQSTVNTIAFSGSDLYAGGTFTQVGTGGIPVTGLNFIARWNGTAWSALDKGLNSGVLKIAISGSNVYAGGAFTNVGSGGTPVSGLNRIAKWDGAAWSALDQGLNSWVFGLTTDGSSVYAGGQFTAVEAGGTPVSGLNSIGRWGGPACVSPVAFTVTGGGASCAGSGVAIGLSGSETGITYQLKLGTTDVGTALNGSGSALAFPAQSTVGTYTVVATRTAGCTANMTGSALITAATQVIYYLDMDNDTYGNPSMTINSCSGAPAGYVANNADCNDNNALEKPGQVWYKDADNDGYGQTGAASLTQCLRPMGYKLATGMAATTGDCNDDPTTGGMTNPAATEICDGTDNNCNGANDEGVQTTYYQDQDNDGYGNPGATQAACSQPVGYVINNADCNDTNTLEKPGQVWYADADNDGYSNGATLTQCLRPMGYKLATEMVAVTGDCNDNSAAVNPVAADLCDGVDNDCNGTTDEGEAGPAPGWTAGAVGSATNTGESFSCGSPTASGMAMSVSSQGYAMGANADLIYSNYQQRCGDVVFTAHITGNPAPGWAGIYIRESLYKGSKMVALKTNLSSFLRREIRTTTDGNKTTGQSLPYASNTWVRIERMGNTFNFYTSPNGTAGSWTFFGASTVMMSSCVYLGVFAESINATTTITASFDNVSITGGTAPLAVNPNTRFELQEQPTTTDVMVYPNPSSGEVFLQVKNPDLYGRPLQVQLINAVGAEVRAMQLGNAEDAMELPGLSTLPNGIYWLRLQTPGVAPVTQRLVIQH